MVIKNAGLDFFLNAFPHVEGKLGSGIFIHNFETDTLQYSNGLCEIFELKHFPKKAETHFFLNFIVQQDREPVKEQFLKLLKIGTPFDFDFSIISSKGKLKRISTTNFVSKNKDKKLIKHNCLMRDVTENYDHKIALEQKIKQLNITNLHLQEFVYIASHDLKEPLRKISTFGERLQTKIGNSLSDEGTMYLDRLLKSSRNMESLLDELLAFSRISLEELKFEKTSLAKCLESVISDLELSIEESQASITFDKLPEIEANPTQIKQLFSNLLSNALKFKSKNQTPLINITCSEKKANQKNAIYPNLKTDSYLIEIRDNGIGFEQEYAEKIFLMFQRLNGKAEYSGSGVGLAICKKIIDNHHGLIFANSIVNKGSVFTLILPKKQVR